MTITGDGVADFSCAASRLTMGMSGAGNLEMRQVGGTVHVKMPDELAAQMPDTKPRVRVDLDAVYGRQYGGGPTQGVASSDPTRQFEYLRGASESVEKVGEERVRGVPTTRYGAVTDLREGAAGQDAQVRQANEELVKRLGTSKPPVEVWIDEKNRVRRYALDVSVPMPEDATSQDVSQEDDELSTQMVIEYYDFGAPIDVQAPEQTTDGSEPFAGQQPAEQ